MLGQQGQDTAEVLDPAAEQKMVQNVMDALLQDGHTHEPKVSHPYACAVHHHYLLCPHSIVQQQAARTERGFQHVS